MFDITLRMLTGQQRNSHDEVYNIPHMMISQHWSVHLVAIYRIMAEEYASIERLVTKSYKMWDPVLAGCLLENNHKVTSAGSMCPQIEVAE